MTTHNRDKVIAIAEEVKASNDMFGAFSVALYSIAFEDGRIAERIVTIKDDDDLRFIKRVLEGSNPTGEDKAKCTLLIHEIRSRARGDTK